MNFVQNYLHELIFMQIILNNKPLLKKKNSFFINSYLNGENKFCKNNLQFPDKDYVDYIPFSP